MTRAAPDAISRGPVPRRVPAAGVAVLVAAAVRALRAAGGALRAVGARRAGGQRAGQGGARERVLGTGPLALLAGLPRTVGARPAGRTRR